MRELTIISLLIVTDKNVETKGLSVMQISFLAVE